MGKLGRFCGVSRFSRVSGFRFQGLGWSGSGLWGFRVGVSGFGGVEGGGFRVLGLSCFRALVSFV